MFIKATLQLSVDVPIVTVQQVRQALLSALLMDLRQSQAGSCFTTAVSIKVHSHQQERFLQDMKAMIENGYMKRSIHGKEYKLFWSTIPGKEIGFEDSYQTNTKENTLAALRGVGYTLLQAQEIYKAQVENPSELSPKNPRDLIETLAAERLGISQEVLNERRQLEELPKPDEKAIPILSSRIKVIDRKFEAYDELVSYAKACFTATSHNLLLRGWEYGLGATGKIENIPLRGQLSHEANNIYKLLWGESASTRTHYGIDRALEFLTDEILKTNETLSEGQRLSFKQKLSESFTRQFEKIFSDRVKQQYQYGGFALYDTADLAHWNEIQLISPLSNPIELQDLVGKLIMETGFELRKDFDKEYSGLIISIATRLSQHVRSEDFFEHFIRSVSHQIENDDIKLKPSDKIPENKELRSRFKNLIEGGKANPVLMQIYYESPITPVNFVARNAEDLLVHLIREARKLNINKDQKLLLPLSGGGHLYLFMPNHPSFRSALDSDVDPQEWVDRHVRQQGEAIVFADSNWATDGVHRMFAISKNERGEIIFSTIDETGQTIAGGVDSVGMKQESMSQDAWVNDRYFWLWTDLG